MPRSHSQRVPLDANSERQAVRLLCMVTTLASLMIGVILLGVGAYLAAAGCAVVAGVAMIMTITMYTHLHQEELARDARATATRAVADPFGER